MRARKRKCVHAHAISHPAQARNLASTQSHKHAISHPAQAVVEEMRTVKFFSELPRDTMLELARVMRIERLEELSVVFRQGDAGTHFYIVLSGSVYHPPSFFTMA